MTLINNIITKLSENLLYIILIIFIFFISITHATISNKKLNNTSSIQTLIRQCSRWAVAAAQDKSPIIALLHANYAAGYLWALKDIASDSEIKKVTNIDMQLFTNKITNIQDMCTKKVSQACPQFLDHIDKSLAKLGGDM